MSEKTSKTPEKREGIVKTLLIIAIPIIFGNLLESVTEIVDMHFIGTLGTTVMAGASPAVSVSALVLTFFLGIGIAVSAYVSRAHGMGDKKLIGHTLTHAVILAIILGFIFAIIGFLCTDKIMLVMTQGNAETAAYGTAYLFPLLVGSVLLVFLFVMTCAFQSIGKPLIPMIALIGVNILNALLNPILIGAMGIQGSAIATLIARGLGGFVLIVLMYILPCAKEAGLKFGPLRFNDKLFWGIITVALPSAIQGCVRNFGLMIMTLLVAGFGVSAVAAYGVCTRTDLLALMIGLSIAQAVCVLVGQNLGAGNVDRAVRTVRYATVFNAIIMGIIAVIFITCAPAILGFFGATGEALSIGLIWMAIVPLASILMGVALIFGFAMSGAGLTWPGMIAVLVGQVLIPITICVLSLVNSWPIGIVFVGVCIGIVANFLIDFMFYKTGMWKRHTLIVGE